MNWIKPFRIFATLISVTGIGILISVFFETFSGEIIEEILPGYNHSFKNKFLALLLALPVPFHIISIGMIIQKKWLSIKMKKVAWICIISSGIWLGITLILKYIVI